MLDQSTDSPAQKRAAYSPAPSQERGQRQPNYTILGTSRLGSTCLIGRPPRWNIQSITVDCRAPCVGKGDRTPYRGTCTSACIKHAPRRLSGLSGGICFTGVHGPRPIADSNVTNRVPVVSVRDHVVRRTRASSWEPKTVPADSRLEEAAPIAGVPAYPPLFGPITATSLANPHCDKGAPPPKTQAKMRDRATGLGGGVGSWWEQRRDLTLSALGVSAFLSPRVH